jgi:hypothetical protein
MSEIVREEISEKKFEVTDENLYTIDEAIKWLEQSKKEGATHVRFSAWGYEDFAPDVTLRTYLDRPETKDEEEFRLRRNEQYEKERTQREFEEYKRLAEKFKDNT